jgi:hypothetical protein
VEENLSGTSTANKAFIDGIIDGRTKNAADGTDCKRRMRIFRRKLASKDQQSLP